MINCIIVDDQPASIDLLSSFINTTESIELFNSTSEPLSAIGYLDSHPEINLIFLDVEMPTITGFDFLEILQQKNANMLPLVVLTTGHSAYAVNGYQFDRVVGFLHKLITYKSFLEMVHKVKRILPIYQSTYSLTLADMSTTIGSDNSFFIKVSYNRKEKYVHLQFDELLYVQGQRNYASLVTISDTYSVRRPLREIENMLPGSLFARTHKSYIVNLKHIRYIDTTSAMLREKHEVPVSTTYREGIMKRVSRTIVDDK